MSFKKVCDYYDSDPAVLRAIRGGLDTGYARALASVDPYRAGALRRLAEEGLPDAVRRLWPEAVRPLFPGIPEDLAYLGAWGLAHGSPYAACLRASALYSAKDDAVFLAAVKAADKLGGCARTRESRIFLDPEYAVRRLRSSVERLHLNWDEGPDRDARSYRQTVLRWRLARLLGESAGCRSVSVWDIMARLCPAARTEIANELALFARKADEAGVRIEKIPSVFAVFFSQDETEAILDPSLSGFYLTKLEAADRVKETRRDLRISRRETGIGGFAVKLAGFAFAEANRSAELFRSLFEEFGVSSSCFLGSAPFKRFCAAAALPGGERASLALALGNSLWLTNEWFYSGAFGNGTLSPFALSFAEELFGSGLPEWYGRGPDAVAQAFLAGRLQGAGLKRFFLAAGQQLSRRMKEALIAAGSWEHFFSLKDEEFEAAGWRVLLRHPDPRIRQQVLSSLAREKDPKAYLQFVAEGKAKGGLAWLEDPEAERRFVFDFHGTELWKRAGGLALEKDPKLAASIAWGSETFHGRAEDLALAFTGLRGGKGLFRLRLMLTPPGIARAGARERFAEAIAGLSAANLEGLVEGFLLSRERDEISAFLEDLASPRILQALSKRFRQLFARRGKDAAVLWEKLAQARRHLSDGLIRGELREHARQLEKMKDPAADSFGLFAALWPSPSARRVKWLATAVDWSRPRGDRLAKAYRQFKIPKKHGGFRTISAPVFPLKDLQRGVLEQLLEPLGAHPAAMGFVRGRSIADNAARHAGQPVVAVADVHSCFPSVKWPVLYRVLERDLGEKIGMPAVRLVCELCTLEGGLPMGSPASPALLNRVLLRADEILSAEAEKAGCRYTRYADDITFSGGEAAVGLLGRAKSVLASAGLELDPKKTNIFRPGRRQKVTGLVVNVKPNVPRDYRKLVRAAVHKYCSGGTPEWKGSPMTKAELLGRVAFVGSVRPEEARVLAEAVRKEDARRRAEDEEARAASGSAAAGPEECAGEEA